MIATFSPSIFLGHQYGSAMSIHHSGVDFASMVRFPRIFQGGSGIIFHTFVGNIPQIVLSFVYFTYSGLFTSIYEDLEWHSYSLRRKSLRVSGQPRGLQRPSHFLQLPYRISLPLIAVSGLVHWLVSQAIFMVNLEVYLLPICNITNCDQLSNSEALVPLQYTSSQLKMNGTWDLTDSEIIACGFSIGAMMGITCVEALLIMTAVWAGFQKLKDTGQPVVGSCSAAISAACHPVEDAKTDGISEEELQWGVLSMDRDDEMGHCGFSNDEVGALDPAFLYSGKRLRAKGCKYEKTFD